LLTNHRLCIMSTLYPHLRLVRLVVFEWVVLKTTLALGTIVGRIERWPDVKDVGHMLLMAFGATTDAPGSVDAL
jgi:hypothetical protein